MTKPVLLGGVLGGLLGGAGGFALLRSFPSAAKTVPAADAGQSAARPLADALVATLRAGRYDEFFATVRVGLAEMTAEEFGKFRQEIVGVRDRFAKEYGAAGGFEFARETVLSPSLVRFAYVEKYARGCVMCFAVFYNTPDGWQVIAFSYQPLQTAFNTLR